MSNRNRSQAFSLHPSHFILLSPLRGSVRARACCPMACAMGYFLPPPPGAAGLVAQSAVVAVCGHRWLEMKNRGLKPGSPRYWLAAVLPLKLQAAELKNNSALPLHSPSS